jgi:myxalamid-type polyketide synthase MxaE and MxaD
VFGDPYGISNHIINRMKAKQFHCVYITPGERFAQLAEDHYTIVFGNKQHYEKVLNMVESFQGIVHMSSLNYAWKGTGVTAEQIESHQIYGSIGFLFLYQALAARKLVRMPGITIVTNGMQAITDNDVAHPIHRPLWGLAKVMMNECSELSIKYFDLHAEPSARQMDDIVIELISPHEGENEIAFRDGRYVPRLLMPSEEISVTVEQKGFRSNVTYVITGYGGIAFEFIEWMISKGARNFALISRSGKITGSMRSRIAALNESGCTMKVFSADVSNYQELKNVFEKVELSLPPLGGIVHAAGTIKANSLTSVNAQELLYILNPKMKGAWNLHLLTQHKVLDCFILFSSAAALIGLSGQGSYVAANAFLDGLAYMRRSLGLPALSVNWGVIRDAGMVANDPELERYAKEEGFTPVTMPRAMEVFDRIYQQNYTQIGIMKLDLTRLSIYYSQLSARGYFKSLLRTAESVGNNVQPVPGRLSHHLSREEKNASLLECLIKEVSTVTRVSSERIKPLMTFKELGLDSIMAIQLRNKLESTFGLKLSVGMFWNYPSIGEYASFASRLISESQTVRSEEKQPSKWLVIPRPNPAARCRVFCFHDAGGDSTLFSGWEDLLGNQFEVVAIELPGRGKNLYSEKSLQLPELVIQLKKELRTHLDKPYLFFGHSMGGLIAFETARALRHESVVQPELIMLSSVPALGTYSEQDIDFENLSNSILGRKPIDAAIRKSVLRLLEDDLRMISKYRYQPDEPLTTGLIVIRGYGDQRVNDEQAKKWIGETSNYFKVITRPGGHRYIIEDSTFLTSLIGKVWMQKQNNDLVVENTDQVAISILTV